jgi:hypothetical protein
MCEGMRRVPHDGVPKIVTRRIPSHTLGDRSFCRPGPGVIIVLDKHLVLTGPLLWPVTVNMQGLISGR